MADKPFRVRNLRVNRGFACRLAIRQYGKAAMQFEIGLGSAVGRHLGWSEDTRVAIEFFEKPYKIVLTKTQNAEDFAVRRTGPEGSWARVISFSDFPAWIRREAQTVRLIAVRSVGPDMLIIEVPEVMVSGPVDRREQT